jgi:hypothetical protein
MPFTCWRIMFTDQKNPKHLEQAAAILRTVPNLRRFAGRPGIQSGTDAAEESTTICEDVARAAHREVERIDAVLHTLRPESKSRVEAMLGVISYCYAKGLFDSEEIEQLLWRDHAFLATFEGDIPAAWAIRCFRRRHHGNILAIIEQALQEYRRRTQNHPSLPAETDATPPHSDSVRMNAERLLAMANVTDQLAAD